MASNDDKKLAEVFAAELAEKTVLEAFDYLKYFSSLHRRLFPFMGYDISAEFRPLDGDTICVSLPGSDEVLFSIKRETHSTDAHILQVPFPDWIKFKLASRWTEAADEKRPPALPAAAKSAEEALDHRKGARPSSVLAEEAREDSLHALPPDPWDNLTKAQQLITETRDNCLYFARQAHKGQERRNGDDYFEAHVRPVAETFPHGSLERCVALLHDVAEDCFDNWADFVAAAKKEGIPAVVTNIVKFLTKGEGTYENYIFQLSKCRVARRVKIADILNNLADAPTEKQAQKYGRALKVLLPTSQIREL